MSHQQERTDAIHRIVADAERRRLRLVDTLRGRRAEELPLRFWRQQVHFTTPATDPAVARKAVESGYGATRRIFERFDISPADVARALGVPEQRVRDLLDRPSTAAPVVVVDSEDAQAPREEVVQRGREAAAAVFRDAAWPPDTLRFFRPNGLERGAWAAHDLAQVLVGAGPGGVDAIVFPKADHPEEIRWLDETLGAVEETLGVPHHSIKVELLVESGWGIRNLEQLAVAILPRLVGIVWGIADYASDVGLPEVRNDHPVADWARIEMVNLAGAIGVPAIDTMTFDYPVADPSLSREQNRVRILDRLQRVYEHTLHGLQLGMSGKWAGHPAQVFAVLLAHESALDQADVEAKLREVEAYNAAVAEERGAAILDGMMVDRATDRHARAVLRRAAALGRIDAHRARAAGVISPGE